MTNFSLKIFLLPGIDGTGEFFVPLKKALGPNTETNVVRYKDERTFEDYVESVASLLPDENAVLIAESFSGPIALALMERYPSRIKCAVLSATFAISPFRKLTKVAEYVPTVFFTPNPLQARIVKTFCLPKEPESELLNLVMQVIYSITPITRKERLAVLSKVDMRPILSKITQPVLCLKASQDRVVAATLADMLVSGLPNVEVCEINGPHMLLQTCPDECAHEIIRFLSQCV
ncbi:MAG: alpha/beta hydrolase [Gammaproteobacteria bacterium]|nr:MAG: alpha/beta hydrolase [Gammaproteobacteria bacterium]